MTQTPVQTKGERTRAAILDEALKIVSKAGLDGLTDGTLAEATGLSKSGLFAHFGSREELLLAVLAHGQAEFTEVVFQPAMAKPRGIARLKAMFTNWLDWTESAELPGGCPMIGGASEFDDRPGPVRDAVVEHFARLERELGRAVELAIGQGHLRADLDVEQFVFDMMGIIFAYYHGARLFDVARAESRARVAFERLVAAASPTP